VVLGLDEVWATFGAKNGDPDPLRFLTRVCVRLGAHCEAALPVESR